MSGPTGDKPHHSRVLDALARTHDAWTAVHHSKHAAAEEVAAARRAALQASEPTEGGDSASDAG